MHVVSSLESDAWKKPYPMIMAHIGDPAHAPTNRFRSSPASMVRLVQTEEPDRRRRHRG